jgi:DNA-binding PadR family transcriptional regulator
MQHNFNIFLAQMYSVEEAIFLQNIHFWYKHNKRNNKNFYDGKYWTYNSVYAFTQEFVYLSEKQIRNILHKLETKGLIITGNYNKIAYDRTKWYSITEKGLEILDKLGIHKEEETKSNPNTKKENTNLPNKEIQFTKRANGTTEKGEPIPDLNTDIIPKDIIIINNNNNNEIEFLKSKQLQLLGEYKDDIIDLYEYKFFNDLVIDNNDSKYKIDAMLKTDEFALIEKKCRKLKSQIIKPETINRKNLINYFNDIGKIQVSDNIFLYPYEIIKLRMVYNPKFLTKKVREFDNFCFEDKNFKRYIDHYSTIKNWLDTEIEKVKKNPKYEKSEIYHYYNWGVSRNEI